MKFKLVVLVVLLAATFFGIFIPEVARAITNPNAITIAEVAVFKDLWATGDQLYFVRYNCYYAATPVEDASTTFQEAIYDVAGTSILFSRPLNYYQHNIISIYLTPAQALTWGSAYNVKIMGMPSIFTLVEGTNMRTSTLVAADYKATSSFASYIIAQAQILQTSWGITLLNTSNRLNTTGSTYFTKAIPGLGDIHPEIFETYSTTPTVTVGNFTRAYTGVAAARAGTVLPGALNGIGTYFGTNGNWVAFWIVLMMCGMVAAGLFSATKHPGVGLVMGIPVYVAFAWLGIGIDLLIGLGVIVVVVAILFGVVFILGRLA